MHESKNPKFDTAEITALSHLYRGEMYRSTVWRTRLDATTNWAVVTTGLALSLTFSSEAASPLPLVLVGLLVAVFLLIEGRRIVSSISFASGPISSKCISSGRFCADKAYASTTAGTRHSIRTTLLPLCTSHFSKRSAGGCDTIMAGSFSFR
jgi:Predicted integral membrane protein (DUF2270)